MPTTDPRLKSPEYNLEIGTDTPNVRLILKELEEVKDSAARYCDRNRQAHRWWYARWDGQDVDGRKHAGVDGRDVHPFEGASDTRLRTVDQYVNDYVMLGQFAFNNGKPQADSEQRMAPGIGRQVSKVTKLLKWQTMVQMRSNLQLEVPLALNWRMGYGAALMGVNWWQCRRLDELDLDIPLLADIVAAQTGQNPSEAFWEVQSAVHDPAMFDRMASFIRSLSDIVSLGMARSIVESLQQTGYAMIPKARTFKSQPHWTAWRPGVEVLFRDLTGDLQEEPWLDWRERVSETDLYDRIKTEDYDPRFVEQAIQRKGEGSDDLWLQQTLAERGVYGGYADRPSWVNSYANTIELHHFIYKARVHGTPKLFRTIFNEGVAGRDLRNPLVAHHGTFPYDHGNYPAVAMRFEKKERPILSSRGIAELAYTWEQEEKAQADGLVDRAALENAPPLIVSWSKRDQVRNEFGPRGMLAVGRGDVSWMPMPQSTGISERAMSYVARRCERYFPIFGADLDPDLRNMKRIQLAGEVNGEWCLCYEMTVDLDRQYLPDSDVEEVVGQLQMPFHISRQEIQKHTIRIVFDPKTIDTEYAKEKIGLVGMMMQFNQGGTAITNAIFRSGMELIDTDWADQAVEDAPAASERERNDEKQALAQILVGIEPDKPKFANHQLRLDTLQQSLQTPGMAERVQRDATVQELLKNRIEFHQNQIQQYQVNPEIGRNVSTSTFGKGAPSMAALLQG